MITIGITCSHFEMPADEDNVWRLTRYMDAIRAAGATPEMLWIPTDEAFAMHAHLVAERIDGLLIPGGADLPPAMYGEAVQPDAGVEMIRPQRPLWEVALAEEFSQSGKPILGICYGCQFLNVWRGGSLIQDIPTQWPNPIPHSLVRHGVHAGEDSKLAAIVGGEEFVVESSHHQAIGRLAPGAILCAMAPDGVAEAVEWRDEAWTLGVQWHPERDPDSVPTRRLFAAFVEAAQVRAGAKSSADSSATPVEIAGVS